MEKTSNLIALIPLLPLVGACINLLFGRKIQKSTGHGLVHTIAIGSVLAAFGVTLYLVFGQLLPMYKAWASLGDTKPEVLQGLVQTVFHWIEIGQEGDPLYLNIDLAFRLDTLSAVMLLIITGVGTLIHIYSVGYMHHEPRYSAYFGYLNLFTSSMLILVLGESLPIMFIGWEGVGLCSYLLIGFWFQKTANANAGRKAFVVNRIGDFAFLIGVCLLFLKAGTVSFSELQTAEAVGVFKTQLWGERIAMFAGLFLFIGACGKSAQIPLYVWLPDAMAGPTPVSALIHAATMVTAGVYMIARTSFLYAHSTTVMAIVAGVGAATALFAAIMAFAQTDLKKVLAYSTVSQLGFMFVGVGVGAYAAGVFHLMTHAFFKAGLFLAAGSVMHAMSNSGDITKMGGLRRYIPTTHLCFLIYCLAIAGIFPFAGFFSKDEILAAAFFADADGWALWYGKAIWLTLTVAAMGTAFYMFRLYFLVFAGNEVRCDEKTKAAIHESPFSMTFPLMVLALLATVSGFLGLPHLSKFHWPHILPDWLSASFVDFSRHSLEHSIHVGHHSDSMIMMLMAAAMGLAIVAIFFAWRMYGKGPSAFAEKFAKGPLGSGIHHVVQNKFFIDEIYEKYVLGPFRWACKMLFYVLDRTLIDDIAVNGLGKVVAGFGGVIRWFQNGQVQRYLVGLVLGAAAIMFFSGRQKIDFTVVESDGHAMFTPRIGAGPHTHGAEVAFDFDYDGEADITETYHPGKSYSAGKSLAMGGEYKVRMWMTDAVTQEKYEVVKEINLGKQTPDKGSKH